jgi:predicted anti-sigma-YlaC factor YlaD
MFGHLKAEDFMNLAEGAALPQNQQLHLKSCARCQAMLQSVEDTRQQLSEMQAAAEESIPEPDWAEFRSDIRNTLLSRSVRREAASRTWLGGIGWKPALAWSLSVMFMLGLGAGVLLWNGDDAGAPTQVASIEEPLSEIEAIDAAASMTQTDIFAEVLDLDEREAESLRAILEGMTQEGVSQQ